MRTLRMVTVNMLRPRALPPSAFPCYEGSSLAFCSRTGFVCVSGDFESAKKCPWLASRAARHFPFHREEIKSQRRPLAVHSLTLNQPDLVFADAEALNDQLARLGHIHLLVLGIDDGQKNLFATVFSK